MSVPKDLLYASSHEWVKLLEDGKALVGITDYAQESLGDLVYVELPHVGDVFQEGDNLAVVESVKATSDVFAPIDGKVSAVNEQLEDTPEAINEDSYDAWIVEMEELGEVNLMSPEEYETFLEEAE